MNPRTKNLAMVGGAVLVVGFVAVNTLMAPAAPLAPAAEPAVTTAPTEPDGTIAAPGSSPAAGDRSVPTSTGAAARPAAPVKATPGALVEEALSPSDPDRRSYAIGLHDLAGLPPDAAAGTRLELWVTWEPPATRRPRLQKLIGDVVLERTIPGSVPEAPVTILLSVPADRVGDLIYADGYGRLSVALPH